MENNNKKPKEHKLDSVRIGQVVDSSKVLVNYTVPLSFTLFRERPLDEYEEIVQKNYGSAQQTYSIL